MTDDATRSRTITWQDPMIGASRAKEMAGLDYLQAMIDGDVPPPPIITLMNMTLESVGTGTATFSCLPNESHYNPIGSVHGGFLCTVLDSAAGCAVHTTLPAGVGYTSLEIKVSYLRAVSTTTGTLTVVGRVTKPGSRVAFAEAVVTDGEGRIVATATSTLLVFPVQRN
ncbi:PaaI family thioesterase [Glaciihabitans arcticus]|uniref:PaaI family thioesterase n=1 Tax=Glaciihabitans arcticus TaxID=2668039 RepID=A0A4Q9GQL1_9MICO|nr:PaaI family thioesterase [Glaciihabitans arcticus]TBN57166.1 PaaI family thioesterase [Glaciihabitans arcticus]